MEGCGVGRCGGDARVVGDYILGPKVGAGSFAVVWRARHRLLGVEVAVKEIDKKQLSSKLREGLFKEIDILRNISHPNIIRLHEAIQTEEKIYLVLEYCTGGDLAAYISCHGRVSEAVARHFMRQLASGLQVLRENNLIHRDLKPQNLLLSTNDENSVLKIGDFGFARYLMPQGLADTLCGSPLYMAPEIIQNQKYDAKADLWSVGAILFQLVIGKPPFDGNSQFQLFQNVLASHELHFPQDIVGELHHDCIDLCKSLLRQNPVERLTFEEFFDHKFLAVERTSGSCDEFLHNTVDDRSRKPGGCDPSSSSDVRDNKTVSSISKAGDSLQSVEWEYVLVNPNLASMETISSSFELSLLDNSTARPTYILQKIGKCFAGQPQAGEFAFGSTYGLDGAAESHVYAPEASLSMELNAQRMSSSHPSRRLQLLYQYVCALSEVAKEKLNAGLRLESFSVELVSLAVWKEALRVSTSSFSIKDQQSHEKDKSISLSGHVDFSRSQTVHSWAEQGFLTAFDRAETISNDLQDVDGNAKMPDAMEIIFQTALSAGRSGAVNEFMGNRHNAVVAYAKATVLFSFILMEATSLPLNPPFSLSTSDQQRIYKYISSLEAHLSRFQVHCPSTRETDQSPT